ncbi:MAG: universal stress protein [Deltaproteobacteria bacterium]|nr:universal stress protein [Deltaproteobacteria bacterium]
MKAIKNIIVPLDFSDCSKHAFYYALDIARKEKAELFLLHIIDLDLLDTISSLKLCSTAKARKLMEQNAKAEFNRLRKEAAKKAMVNVREIIEDGIPFLKILNKARDLSVDMIVMGSFGASSPVRRLFFGSTTEKVLKGANIPILCVPLPLVIEG